jgi:hypothetical protein
MPDCRCLSFTNLSLYKVLSRYKYAKKEIQDWIKLYPERKNIVIYSMDLSYLRAVYEIKNEYPDIKITLIITDLIKYMIGPENIIRKTVSDFMDNKASKYLNSVDNFVLLSKYMLEHLNIGNRPYVIVEGIYDHSSETPIVSKEIYKTIFYSGTLAKKYGILHLLNAFTEIKDVNYRLWVCGEGDAKDKVIEYAKKDGRIVYMGQLPRQEVITLQKKATVLVNPRASTDEYTKYSFPSKTMEYMVSGTPIIMHPLKCLTEEYLNHLYIASDETDDGLKNTIINVCEKKPEELISFGEKAKNFIINEKNSVIQVKKILRMLDNEE